MQDCKRIDIPFSIDFKLERTIKRPLRQKILLSKEKWFESYNI